MTIDHAILRALLAAPGTAVSGEVLAETSGVSRASIKKHIDHLVKVGYPISATPKKGYTLGRKLPDIWCADEITARLELARRSPQALPWQPVLFRETASTNDLALREGQTGTPEGWVALAESQTAGRGRARREWNSPPSSGLWCSLLLRPTGPPAYVTRLTLLAAVALAEALDHVAEGRFHVDIKWPNDLQIEGRKLGGILTEAQVEPGGVQFAVVGFGLNVNRSENSFPDDLRRKATSLQIAAGRSFRRAELLTSILLHVEKYYPMPFSAVRELWKARCVTLGTEVEIRANAEDPASPVEIAGVAEDIDERGALLLRRPDGTRETVEAGDAVSARPAS